MQQLLLDDQLQNYEENKGLLLNQRKSQWANRFRSIQILIDGTKRAVVKNGHVVELELDSGEYQVQVKIDWCKTKALTLRVNAYETYAYETGCQYSRGQLLIPFLSFYYIFVRPSTYLYFQKQP